MNDSTNNAAAAMTVDIIQEANEVYASTSANFSATTLVVYATLITFSREIEHIWCRPFSLPTLLYIFARYGNLISQGLSLSGDFISSERSCNILADVQNIISFLPYIGVQGLLVIRAYSICEGNKILISALALGLFSYFCLELYQTIAFPGCSSSPNISTGLAIDVAGDIINVATDLLIFGICMWKVWGTWRLKCKSGIRDSSSLVSLFLTQSILRCCFVITITVAGVLIVWLTSSESPQFLVSQSYSLMQNALSVTLVADFALDLRNLNSAKIEASQISLPPLRFSNVLQHVHQSFLVEMATPERNMEEARDNVL